MPPIHFLRTFTFFVLVILNPMRSNAIPDVSKDTTLIRLINELEHHSSNDSIKVKMLYNISNRYLNDRIFDLENAQKFALQSLELSRKIDFKIGLATSYKLLGLVERYKGHFDKSREYFKKAITLYKSENSPIFVAGVLYNIGMNYEDQEKYNKSLDYYNEALVLYSEHNDSYGIAKTYNALGTGTLFGLKDNISAQKYFEKGIKCAKENGHNEIVQALNYNYTAALDELTDSDKILEIYFEGVEYAKKNNSDYQLWTVYYNLSYQYYIIGNYSEALVYAKKSLTVAKKLKKQTDILDSHNMIQEVYAAMGNYKLAYEHFIKTDSLETIMVNEQTEKRIAELEVQYETEKKEHENKLLKRNNTIEKQKTKLNSQLFWGTLVTCLLVLLIAWLWFLKYRQRKRATEQEAAHKIEQFSKEVDLLQATINTRLDEVQSTESPNVQIDKLNKLLANPLSERECEVLKELSKGHSNKEIAENLFVSINTIKTHLLKIYTKLDVSNRVQAIKRIMEK